MYRIVESFVHLKLKKKKKSGGRSGEVKGNCPKKTLVFSAIHF